MQDTESGLDVASVLQREAWVKQLLSNAPSWLIAYSGGIDSTYLAALAIESCGFQRVCGVLIDSPSLSRRELDAAVTLAKSISLPLQIMNGREFENPEYIRNDSERCFHCKSDLFENMKTFAETIVHSADQKTSPALAYGANADDAREIRPGMRAAREKNICAPLLEAGMGKQAIRWLAKRRGLSNWNKPARPCLASRIPHGTPVNLAALEMVDRGEGFLESLGFQILRVRFQAGAARVELGFEEQARLKQPGLLGIIEKGLLEIGFSKVDFDSHGYRVGGADSP